MWASQQAFGEVLFSSSAIHIASGALSDTSRPQRISTLAWCVLLIFEWLKEIIWKVAGAFGKETKIDPKILRGQLAQENGKKCNSKWSLTSSLVIPTQEGIAAPPDPIFASVHLHSLALHSPFCTRNVNCCPVRSNPIHFLHRLFANTQNHVLSEEEHETRYLKMCCGVCHGHDF